MSDVMIEAKGLSKNYGDFTALKDVSFAVNRGEVVGFLGPNGAGKTTTMKILTCYISPSEGTAQIAGHDVFADPIEVRRNIGYLPESTPLYTDMLVYDYLSFCAEMRGLTGADAKKHIKMAVEQTSLEEKIGAEIRQLSKGFKQRVGLAQALIHQPPLLILDEPMSGLDPNQAEEIRELIREIGKERTVILSTHNLAEVQMTCDRVLIVAKGKLVADSTAQALQTENRKLHFSVTVLETDKDALDKTAKKAREAFAGMDGVDQVKRNEGRDVGDDEVTFDIYPSADGDLRPKIFRAAVDADLVLVGLQKEMQGLDEVFRELTVGDSEAAPSKEEKDS